MSIIARCACGEPILYAEYGEPPSSLHCTACGCDSSPHETLCMVCDAPNPWKRRDTLHFLCTTCGNVQTWWGELVAGG